MADQLCPDCAVAPGNPHESFCDVARCLHTGHQRLSCFKGHGFRKRRDDDPPERLGVPGSNWVWCDIIDSLTEEHPEVPPRAQVVVDGTDDGTIVAALCGCKPDELHDDCGQEVWTGTWPGVEECVALGWYAYFGPKAEPPETGWVRCAPDHPGAEPDLNRLTLEGHWDRDQLRWVA